MNVTYRSEPVEQLVLLQLGRLAPISEPEQSFVLSLLEKKHRYPVGYEVIAPGQLLEAPLFLLRGWICLAVLLADGRRQILDFYLPGDLVGYCSRPRAHAKASYIALTAIEVSRAVGLMDRMNDPQKHGRLIQALRAGEEEFEQRLFNQIIRNGRQSAMESVASLLLELHARLEVSGQISDNTFSLPITQEMMSDALGLSVVHVNRTLQQLKRRNMIASDGVHIQIRDFPALAALAHGLPHGATGPLLSPPEAS